LNQDNLFSGLSSFAVEMSELRDILVNANQNTLVLGDELCSGTESTSAQALVSAGIQYLSEKRSDESYRQKILNGEDKNHFNRCKILASCRNKYIDYAKKHCSDFDFICVLDWDIYGWSYKGFYDSIFRLQSNNKLASVSAYGVLSDFNNNEYLEKNIDKLLMYDSFAFRPLGFNLPLYPQIQYLFNNYKTDKPTIVRSNFGGMSIYKNKLLLEQKYEAREINGMVDCDHVVINDKISNLGFNHLLNNYFIVSYSRHRFV
jgi:hypothetical protein